MSRSLRGKWKRALWDIVSFVLGKVPTARNDVVVLCALSRAMTLDIVDEIVVGLKNNVQDCIERAQTKRIRLDTNAR